MALDQERRPNGSTVSPSASYLIKPQVTKGLCSWFGPSFVGVPSLRSRSVGPPPSAIHGGGRLSRHPCRSAHCAKPAFSLRPSRDWRCLSFLRRKIRSSSRADQRRIKSIKSIKSRSGADQGWTGMGGSMAFRLKPVPALVRLDERSPPCRSRLAGERGGSGK
jgi:hypothetical protein